MSTFEMLEGQEPIRLSNIFDEQLGDFMPLALAEELFPHYQVNLPLQEIVEIEPVVVTLRQSGYSGGHTTGQGRFWGQVQGRPTIKPMQYLGWQ